jgi:hypothetical protein
MSESVESTVDKATLIYRSDGVVVEPVVVHLDGGYMPVSCRIGSISPVGDGRRSEEQILEHIMRALQRP